MVFLNLKLKLTKQKTKSKERYLEESHFSCMENYYKFCRESTLHGIRFVGDPKLSLIERTIFGLSLVVVAAVISYFITITYQKWTSSPVIISLSPNPTLVKDIPFPAITICNMNAARKAIVSKFNETWQDFYITNWCSNDNSQNINNKLEWKNFTGNWTYYKQFMINVSQPCSEMLLSCKFSNSFENCDEIFDVILTDEGLCCSFNVVAARFIYKDFSLIDTEFQLNRTKKLLAVNWTPEDGFITNSVTGYSPRKAEGSGTAKGLTVMLNANVSDYYCSSSNSVGFKVILHTPAERPKVSDYGSFLSPGLETRIIIAPQLADASDRIRSIKKKERQCVFNDEGNLTYFSTYSRRNCERECEARFILKKCGCVMYHMPRLVNVSRVCNLRDVACYDHIDFEHGLEHFTDSCDCQPGCFDLTFNSDFTQTPMGGKDVIKSAYLKNFSQKYINENIATVHFYFVDTAFRAYTKSEFIGLTDFLSNSGGLLSLLSGFSVISVVELIYFMAVRPFFVMRRNRLATIARHNLIMLKRKNMGPITQLNWNNDLLIEDRRQSKMWELKMRGATVDPMPYIC